MRARSLLLVGAAVVLVPTGAHTLADADQPTAAPELPELPSVADQVDGLYDDDGCLILGAGETDCSVRAEEVDEALSHGPTDEPRRLQGFAGSYWVEEVTGTGPEVLADSVTTATTGGFRADGLVRNHGEVVIESVEVTARLVGAGGDELAVVRATSPVHDVRPGEPAPFTVTADVAADAVDHVDWSASAGGEGDGSARALEWTPYWERPLGGEPVDLYLDHDDTSRPYLQFGSVAVVGDVEVAEPEVLVTWLDGQGRVVRTFAAPVVDPDGAPVAALASGAAGDVLLQADADPPADGEALVWVQGR